MDSYGQYYREYYVDYLMVEFSDALKSDKLAAKYFDRQSRGF